MTRAFSRLTMPATLALVLAAALPAPVAASAPWIGGCSGGAGSNYLCIFEDWHWEGANGHMSGSNDSYVGETYPSNSHNVDNSISSTKNLYNSYRVIWYWNPGYGGFSLCVNPNTGLYTTGSFHQDQFSSHKVVLGVCN